MMKLSKIDWFVAILIFGLILIIGNSCKKGDKNKKLPTITTDYLDVMGTQLTMASSLTSDGGSDIVSRGFCFDINPDVTINNNPVYVSNGNINFGQGQIVWIQRNLLPNKTYFVRAFAENKNGIAYGEELSIHTGPVFIPDVPVIDVEGNLYNTIKIGSQVWMTENLKTTFYSDGTAIPHIQSNSEWQQNYGPAYCWYDNNIVNKETYGALYTWKAVETGKLAPSGWHVPTDEDWEILFQYLGGNSNWNWFAGAKLKEAGTTHWSAPNSGATNESGWTGLPGMFRHYWGEFPSTTGTHSPRSIGIWWSATSIDTSEANNVSLGSGSSSAYISHFSRREGYSVRCVKD